MYINSNLDFWISLIMILDVLLVAIMVISILYYRKSDKEFERRLKEREEYFKKLNSQQNGSSF